MDPRDLMSKSDMSLRQVIVVAVTIALCALDGFDVLAISFASPGISSEWGIDRAALGFVLSMELFGMAIGNVVMGRFADAWGRRPIILFCVTLMATGTCAEVGAAYGKLDKLVKLWGSPLRAPYMTLSFMALLVIPALRAHMERRRP